MPLLRESTSIDAIRSGSDRFMSVSGCDFRAAPRSLRHLAKAALPCARPYVSLDGVATIPDRLATERSCTDGAQRADARRRTAQMYPASSFPFAGKCPGCVMMVWQD
jgi:hypothetical protein